ncbi:hypothetical protein RRG08_046369 [Elysia crispata]|uniref:C-type lectin domain-containing protein n=1 Tax=Elysia crispata TaxID=231223 RepID=A0AAE1AWZ0_9GAST|nr:hypothetical protein RRG08_046369 [Elysia crispata]
MRTDIDELVSTICPQGWIISLESRSCVKRSSEKKSWDQARKACRSVGADLLINYNRKKEKLVSGYSSQLWVGLNHRKQRGVYRWLDKNEQVGASCDVWQQGRSRTFVCSHGLEFYGFTSATCYHFRSVVNVGT